MYGLGKIAAALLALAAVAIPAQGEEAADTTLSPESAIEVEAMVPIVDGDAATARQQALARVFGDIVTIAAEAHTGVGTLAQRPALAVRLRRDATDFLLAYQIVTDTYRLGDAGGPAAGADGPRAATDGGADVEAGEGARAEEDSAPSAALAAPAPALPPDHYLVRVRGWVDETRLRSALGMAEDAGAADLAVTVRAVSSVVKEEGEDRLARLQEAVLGQLRESGWRVAEPEGVARHTLSLDADWVPATGRVEVRLTGRLAATDGRLIAVLQASGESRIGNQYFAWADAERRAASDLGTKLAPVLPPAAHAAQGVQAGSWVDVTISPLSGYQWGLELEDAIREQVTGIGQIDRAGYAEGRFRLRLLFKDPLEALPPRLEAVRWRDFTLRVVARSPTALDVRVQRF